MDMKRFFLYAIVIAALVMAGCGGNGGGGMTGGNGDNGGTTPPPPAGPTVQELFETAQDAEDDADAAAMAATDAVTAAIVDSNNLDVYSVMGDSSMAKMNAQAVLTAQTTVNDAVTTTEAAVSKLMQADMDADEHDNSALDARIVAALAVAEQAVMDAKAQAASTDLALAVDLVMGDDEDNPMTPTSHQEAVAMQISEALMPDTDGTGVRVEHNDEAGAEGTAGTVANARAAEILTVDMDNRVGMTWAKIVTDAGKVIESLPVSATDGGTELVDAASLAGMAATSASMASAPTGDVTYGTEMTDASYMGILGRSFCAGSDCSVDDDSNLTGSWYFTPNDETESYIGTTTDGATTYAVETLFVEFGHWLSANTDATLTDINTFALSAVAQTSPALTVTADLTDTSATYSGMAAGMSVQKELDSDGQPVAGTLHSGAFTADVNLTATFGASPTLGGTIDNFKSDNMYAVDPNWTVELQVRSFNGEFDGGSAANSGRTIASGQDGAWSAAAYGNASERPEGIFGGFNAHFTDGAAAGAYATRKD